MAADRIPAPGRWLFRLGWASLILGLLAYGVQLVVLKQFAVPWYMPGLGTIGLLAMLLAVRKQWTVLRLAGLAVAGLLVAGQWSFLLALSRLPAYAGPEKGDRLPAFTAVRADGSPFTDRDLAGKSTVLLFFRGRW